VTIRVGVFGATGRMGRTVCEAVAADSGLELVAGIDPGGAGETLHGITVVGSPSEAAPMEVAVDFTVLDAARENLAWCAANGVHAVVGTTGFADADLDGFRAAFTRSSCLLAPNFAIGAVLMMRFAELAAPFFDTVEIVELHHDQKIDAPSGTAMQTARRMAAASDDWAADPTRHEVVRRRAWRRRSLAASTSTRSGSAGVVAHQEVLLGTQGQTLTIRHDSYDRTSFMPGVVLACKRVGDRPGLTVGLDELLGL
jgi:4-hydroxy-tetrahydrodipicolinate reductase